jgi:fucose 4-O-acetylase-like acetyltransferase
LVSTHVIGTGSATGIHASDGSLLLYYGDSLMYIRMPLFSFLAGLVYAWRPLQDRQGYVAFMYKKSRRLLVPFLVFVPLIGTAQLLVPDANHRTDLPWYQWYLFPLPPYWFLIATFWIFAAVAFADARGWLSSPRVVAALVGCIFVIDTLVPEGNPDRGILALRSAIFLSMFFMIGLAVTRFGASSVRPQVKWAIVAAGVVLLAITQLGLQGLIPETPYRHSPVGTGLGVAVCLALFWSNPRIRLLARVGSYSAGIYLVHPFTVAGIRSVLTRLGVDIVGVLFVAGLVSGIAGSIIIVILLRRVTGGRAVLGESAAGRRPAPAGRARLTE